MEIVEDDTTLGDYEFFFSVDLGVAAFHERIAIRCGS